MTVPCDILGILTQHSALTPTLLAGESAGAQ